MHEVWLGAWPLASKFKSHGRQMGWGYVSERDAVATIREAIEQGFAGVDTADSYGCGTANRRIAIALSGMSRSAYRLSLKLGYSEVPKGQPFAKTVFLDQFNQALDQLGADYVDILSFHHSYFGLRNEQLDEAIEAISDLKRGGLARRIGFRLFHEYTLRGARDRSGERLAEERLLAAAFDTVHLKLNLLSSERRVEQVRRLAKRKSVFINKPMAQGLLWRSWERSARQFGPEDHRAYREEFRPEAQAKFDEIARWALSNSGAGQLTLPRVAIEFLLRLPGAISVIFGAKSAGQVRAIRQFVNAVDLGREACFSESAIRKELLSPWR